jgi:glycolate oxidase iron-sulfur subunit
MQTNLASFIKDTPQGREADAILRACVHCGFCTATCPTYRLLGDELDGPRGRIYLIKQMLEGSPVTAKTQLHLDRCLTCRACETTCPSGVQFGRLVDIGRELVAERVERPALEVSKRALLRRFLLNRTVFGTLLGLGRTVKSLLPAAWSTAIPSVAPAGAWPAPRHTRTMLVLKGCVQPALAPDIDAAFARVLDRIGISLAYAEGSGCCGALAQHMDAYDEARATMKRNIDTWWPHIERGAEAVVVTASGCGTLVKDYGYMFKDDAAYAAKAARIAELAKDPIEIVEAEWAQLAPLVNVRGAPATRVAFHSPCSLQHGQKIRGRVEKLLRDLGFELTPVAEGHLCCGSAGTYSILQPELSQQLKANKVRAIEAGSPDVVASANIGCIAHIASGTRLPVRHWVELCDERLSIPRHEA